MNATKLINDLKNTDETEFTLSGKKTSAQVQQWPTPIATDAKKMPSKSLSRAVRPDLKFSHRHNGKKTFFVNSSNLETTVNGGQLNPAWVEWLMGFPIGWTELED